MTTPSGTMTGEHLLGSPSISAIRRRPSPAGVALERLKHGRAELLILGRGLGVLSGGRRAFLRLSVERGLVAELDPLRGLLGVLAGSLGGRSGARSSRRGAGAAGAGALSCAKAGRPAIISANPTAVQSAATRWNRQTAYVMEYINLSPRAGLNQLTPPLWRACVGAPVRCPLALIDGAVRLGLRQSRGR